MRKARSMLRGYIVRAIDGHDRTFIHSQFGDTTISVGRGPESLGLLHDDGGFWVSCVRKEMCHGSSFTPMIRALGSCSTDEFLLLDMAAFRQAQATSDLTGEQPETTYVRAFSCILSESLDAAVETFSSCKDPIDNVCRTNGRCDTDEGA